ncbi:hypothetical protein [Cronobacter dublinensis]|uniref:hypothetical protein n=1 Tax=Cronobacter dublinensis TaxID=413497 RepID=UPI000CFD12B4|nr:hypothetical protein [Cronobacter dublinensis]EKK4082198.1 hypothetical protein [Cronobacter dublinensis]ELQ5995857.1 hypothetical protein [Cronobacter dublinensis]ELQ6218270.1 hypothetical protein [Cronobacter dublinensis]MDK1253981.1 hypothetical protein [Cronobacter dublinensis]WEP49169.1 hypothetical protein NMY27_18580 [Cronobacter dublinensis]
MDIWAWYEQYQRDLEEAGKPWITQHVDKLIDSVVEVQTGKTEALLPEARALKKTSGNPWIEVMVGHWEMRHRIGNLGEGEKALGDVVALFERAHQADAAECPQSICVTQDLSACYSNVDGPGWADERIAVCQETLSKITPLRSCFLCLSEEQFFAMIDKGEVEQALAFIHQQMEKRRAAGEEDVNGLKENEAQALMLLGRYDEALAIIDKLHEDEMENSSEQTRQVMMMMKAEVLALMGREEDAREWLLPWDRLTAYNRMRWVRVVEQLARLNPAYNNWQTGSALQLILEQRLEAQAWREAIIVAKTHIAMALARGTTWIARRALSQAKACAARLRNPHDEDDALNAFEQQIAAMETQVELPVPAESLMAWLEERGEQEGVTRDPEQEAQWLMLASAQRPDDENLLMLAAAALEACQANGEATDLLLDWQKRHPQEEASPLFHLLSALINARRYDEIVALADTYNDALPHVALWFKAQVAQAQEDWESLETLSQALRATPQGQHKIAPLMLAGQAAIRQKAHDRATAYFKDAVAMMDAREEDASNILWDLLTAASASEDWTTVREAGARLGMQFSTDEGPVEEEWGTVRLRFFENHDEHFYFAQRTGPVTARVFQPSWRKAPQHMNESVVFDANLLNTPPEDEQERANFIPLHNVVKTLTPGDYAPSWFIDGVDPGEETFNAFVNGVRQRGGAVWVHCESDYQVTDSESGETLPGIYFMLAMPQSVSPLEVDAMLRELTQGWKHPIHWLDVAMSGGLDETRHRQVMERYQL